MRRKIRIVLIILCAWFLFSIIPKTTPSFNTLDNDNICFNTALYSESFNQTVSEYFFLKFTDVNDITSAVTQFSLVNHSNIYWMIEVTSLTEGPPTDNLSGKVYQDNGTGFDLWQPTTLFGSSEIAFGSYSNTAGYTIDPTFESKFPVPFIVPTNQTAVFNQTLPASLLTTYNFNYYYFMNISGTVPAPYDMLLPALPVGIAIAWNGTMNWFDAGSGKMEPDGNETGNILLVAVYFDDGALNYLTESRWNSSNSQWNLIYKLKSPIMELIGSMFEVIIPGSGVTSTGGGEIPGFPIALVALDLLIPIIVMYLRRPKNRLI